MAREKQLQKVELAQVLEKRRLDQALNAKEFAVLAGISYSAARTWFRDPAFPVVGGFVFWQDFVQWRTAKTGLRVGLETSGSSDEGRTGNSVIPAKYSGRAARILSALG